MASKEIYCTVFQLFTKYISLSFSNNPIIWVPFKSHIVHFIDEKLHLVDF